MDSVDKSTQVPTELQSQDVSAYSRSRIQKIASPFSSWVSRKERSLIPLARSPGPGAYIPALDGIRGVAILLVLLHHFTIYGGMQSNTFIDRLYYVVAYVGWSGVDLFFVLSGFLITGILLDTKGGDSFFRNFYMRRVLRIFPLYYGFLVIYLLLIPRITPVSPEYQSLVAQQRWYWSYMVNLNIAIQGWPPYYSIAHFWSLAVEEQFYLIWPLLIFFTTRRTVVILCACLLIASLALRWLLWELGNSLAGYVLTFTRVDTLLVGAALAVLVRDPYIMRRVWRWIPVAAAISGFSLFGIFIWREGLNAEDLAVQTVGYPLLAFLYGTLLVIAITRSSGSLVTRLLESSVLRAFGRYSYAIYIFHHPLILYLSSNIFSARDLPTIAGSQLPGQIAVFVVATTLTFALAWLSWRLWEAPFLQLKSRFEYRPPPTGSFSRAFEVNHARHP